MERLENIKDKKKVVEDFFKWLFEKDNIELSEEIDFSLANQYYDPNIYYTKEILDFFNTDAMKRLGRVSQLGLMVDQNENCYHNRLEHSKGTYNRKLEELIYLTSDEEYKKYVEENGLKLYLVAELIKEAAHDIGHLPLSHIMEIKVMGRRDFHEDIGKRILLEDEQIENALNSIDPELKSTLKKLIEEDSLHLSSHDEGNYDVDRLDYLLRDSLYSGEPIQDYHHEQYKRRYAKTNENDDIMKNEDGSIMLVDQDDKNDSKTRIDVYENSSLGVIEHFLESRVQAYKKMYFSEAIQVKDSLVGIFVNAVLADQTEDTASELKNFINKLKQKDININLNEYLQWDDIRFYTNCFDIAQNCNDANLRKLSGMIIPNLDSLMNLTFSHLNLKNAKANNFEDLKLEDKEFVQQIKELVYSDSELSKMLKNKNYYDKNRLMSFGEQNVKELKQKLQDNVFCSTATVYAYNPKIPIYIEDKHGKVFPLHTHPERSCNWEERKEKMDVVFTTIPSLRAKGLSDEEIEEIRNEFLLRKPELSKEKETVSMRPIRIDSKMEDYFEI